MADNKTKTAEPAELHAAEGTPEWYDEKVTVELFKDSGKYKDDVFVAVNGRGYLIQRGVPVQVPRSVAAVLELSRAQDGQATRFMEQRAEEFAAYSKALGL